MIPNYIIIAVDKQHEIVSAKACQYYNHAYPTAHFYKLKFKDCNIYLIKANEIETIE